MGDIPQSGLMEEFCGCVCGGLEVCDSVEADLHLSRWESVGNKK